MNPGARLSLCALGFFLPCSAALAEAPDPARDAVVMSAVRTPVTKS